MTMEVTVEFTKAELVEMWRRPPEEQIGTAIAKMAEAFSRTQGNIAVMWSGGKDSTALLWLAARLWVGMFGDKPLTVAFADTTNEHKEIYAFFPVFLDYLKEQTGVVIEFMRCRPGKGTTFVSVIREHGLPLVSKHVSMCLRKLKRYINQQGLVWGDVKPYCNYGDRQSTKALQDMGLNKTAVLIGTGYVHSADTFCRDYFLPYKWQPLMGFTAAQISEECCDALKKDIANTALSDKGIHCVMLGEMACDSRQREQAYLKTGCTNIDILTGCGKSKPFGPVTEQTLLGFIQQHNIPQSSYYGDLCSRDGHLCFSKHSRGGCALCGFGIEHEQDRFAKLYFEDYAKCRIGFLPLEKGGLGYKEACEYLNENCGMHIEIPQIDE